LGGVQQSLLRLLATCFSGQAYALHLPNIITIHPYSHSLLNSDSSVY
jgi:hypothetical protein